MMTCDEARAYNVQVNRNVTTETHFRKTSLLLSQIVPEL